MGKASSAKKVARAARAGGSASADSRKLGYPLTIFVILLLGAGLVTYARGNRPAAAGAPTLEDHWHYAYGVYACDQFVPPLVDPPGKPDTLGIHTHEDGVIHIHPFSSAVTGNDANFGEFADFVGIELSDDGFTLPDGREFKDGQKCGDQEGRVVLARWPADAPDADPELIEDDFGDVRFLQDRGVITLAFLPEDADVPRPPSVAQLDQLSDVGPGAGPSTSVIEEGGSTTITGIDGTVTSTTAGDGTTETTDTTDPTDSTDTTAPADDATTTVPDDASTTTAEP
jgi:hypothetical protein